MKEFLADVGHFVIFSLRAIRQVPTIRHRPEEFFKSLFDIGIKTVPIVIWAGFFMGMILGLQLSDALEAIIAGTSQFIGGGLSLSFMKEIGPVLTGFIIVARVCSSVTAQIGTMKVTEQIDALRTFAVDPIGFLVTPRLLAGLVAAPVLGAFAILSGFLGGMIMVILVFNVNFWAFWELAQYPLKLKHVFEAYFKLTVIGGFVMLSSTYMGFETKGGAAGVGAATIRSVVVSSFLVLLLDYFMGMFFVVFR